MGDDAQSCAGGQTSATFCPAPKNFFHQCVNSCPWLPRSKNQCQSHCGENLAKCTRRKVKFVGRTGAVVPITAMKQLVPSAAASWRATSNASRPAQEYPTNAG